MSNNQTLSELIEQVEQVNPKLEDHWQTMAIVESLGYTDRIIKEEFGFADVLEIGQYIYQENSTSPVSNKPPISNQTSSSWGQNVVSEIFAFVEQFSRSFVYVIPLISLLILGNVESTETWKFIPSQLAAVCTLATLASLITSGGFVQMIARRGEFYLGLGYSLQAKRVCISLLGLGMLTSFALALISLWLGFYRSLFPDEYLVIGAIYYLILSLLWMLLSILSLQTILGTPLALIGLTILSWGLKLVGSLGALEAQIVAIFITLFLIAITVLILFRKPENTALAKEKIELPNLSALVYLLTPFFTYGIIYFCFIFADRLVAGWSIDPSSGLEFAIDSAYQRAMDLALLNFLLAVPFSEYFAYRLIRYWYKQAKLVEFEAMTIFSKKLNRIYFLIIGILILIFGLLITFTTIVFDPKPKTTTDLFISLSGCLGYLLLVIGLFNTVILFSLNLSSAGIKTLFPSFLVNLVVGYITANAISPDWAVLGLFAGSALFLFLSHQKISQAMKNPDYAYFLGGY